MAERFVPPHVPVGRPGDPYSKVFGNMVGNFEAFMHYAERRLEELTDPDRATVIPIRRLPTAAVEYEEDELSWLCDQFAVSQVADGSPGARAILKQNQALALESAPGGRFHDGGGAA